MEKILMSACLLGEKVRYDARGQNVESKILDQWKQEGRIVRVCPEMAGGLPVPRPAAEIVGSGGGLAVINNSAKVLRKDGTDVSSEFLQGAQFALSLAQKYQIKLAILKERSPSCGSGEIYDGSFSSKKITDVGVTTALLQQHGIKVFSENQIEEAAAYLAQIE